MKNLLILLFTFVGFTLSAQQEAPPQGINYQAVIYSDNGNSQPGINSPGQLLWNEDVTMRFGIYLGATNPVMVYQEMHLTATDEFGLVSLVIGQGTPQGTPLFESIDWGAGEHFLQVEIDKDAGLNFEIMSYQKLWSVPYALYSEQANSSNYSDSSAYADLAGNGITDVIDNGDGTLTFNYYDGSSYTTDILSGLEGPVGPVGADGQSAYEIWLSQGNTGTEADFLNGLTGPAGNDGVDGADGLSAYEIWLSLGNTGTEQDFLNGLTGPAGNDGVDGADGLSAYEIWLSLGNTGTEQDFLNGLTGPAGNNGVDGVDGLSAYEIWLSLGNTGTEADFLNGLTGPAGNDGVDGADGLSAYEVWLSLGNTGTEADFLNGLTGPAGSDGVDGADGLSAYEVWLSLGNTGTEQDFLNGLTGPTGNNGVDGTDGLSAYEVWLSLGNTGTEADFLNGLTGPQGPAGATGPQGPQGDPGSFPNGTNNGDMLYWDGTNWTIVTGASSNNQILTWCDGIPTWTPDGICPGTAQGTINTLDCASAATTGTLIEGQAASGVSVSVPYTGGDGGTHNGQSVSSTGVTGLTATLTAGSFATGNGSLSYTISGTPSASGTASFALDIGGQSCTLSINVEVDFASQYPSGTVFCSSGPTAIVDVTNPTTGAIWMDRNLGASQAATSSTDIDAYGDLYQWGRFSDGHQCRTSNTTVTLSSVDQPAHGDFITVNSGNYDWRSPQNDNLWQGVNGINNPCPSGYRIPTEAELEAERLSWSITTSSVGAFASALKLPMAGSRNLSNGSLIGVGTFGSYWSSTVSGATSRSLYFASSDASMGDSDRANGRSVRCIKDNSTAQGSINTLDCGTATTTGTLTDGQAASGVSVSVPYTGGDGGTHNGQSVSSTGVTGLTATLTAGTFANGSGSLSYTISGTPSASGTASFALNIGGQSCTITMNVQAGSGSQYPSGTVFCASGPTAIVDVTNPTTGAIWMDRNLGASQAATSGTDTNSYGDMYQWGRFSDGHQCRTSVINPMQSSTDQPAHGDWITPPNGSNWDWRITPNDNLWQGVNGVNNPCPSGYRIPTEIELVAENDSWITNDAAGAMSSPLKLPFGGDRYSDIGSFANVGASGRYWSSTITISYIGANALYFEDLGSFGSVGYARGDGSSVRCIKD